MDCSVKKLAPPVPTWAPTDPQDSQLGHFVSQTLKFHDASTSQQLHEWSVNEQEEFWNAVWDFGSVIGERGRQAIIETELPESKFFPEAKLSLVENLLVHETSITFVEESDFTNKGETYSSAMLCEKIVAIVEEFEDSSLTELDRAVAILPVGIAALSFVLAGFESGVITSTASPEFGASAIIARFAQLEPKVLVAATQYHWQGKCFDRSDIINQVVSGIPSIEKVILVGDTNNSFISLNQIKIVRWEELLPNSKSLALKRRAFDYPAYLLFTSGTTGAPKGLLHRAGGVLLKHIVEQRLHCDIGPGDRVCFYTTTGWMMWNWEISVLATGAELVLYDGSPNFPDLLRLFKFAQSQKLTHLGTSARLLDVIRESGLSPADLGKYPFLRVLMITGSPLSETTGRWISQALGEKVLIAPFSGGTDLVGCFTGPNPLVPFFAGQMQGPILGMGIDILDDDGNSVSDGVIGELVCKRPFPTVPLGIWGDTDGTKFNSTYFHSWPGVWMHGDLASFTPEGGVIIHGRSDATLNIGGVRIGTGEIYNAIEGMKEISGALAVAQPWKGDKRIILFVIPKDKILDKDFSAKLKSKIRESASPRHVPAEIFFVSDLPRTFNGKLVEIAIADLVNGRAIKSLASLANPEILDEFARVLRESP